MSFLEHLKKSRKNRTSIALVEGITAHPFSFLLSPFKVADHLRPKSKTKTKQRQSQQSFSATRYRNMDESESVLFFRPKKRLPIKACTIDFGGGRTRHSETIVMDAPRRASSSLKQRNGKNVKSKKEKAEKYSIHPNVSKYALNGSLEMRISSLGIRAEANQNDLDTINASPKRLSSSHMSRDKEIRLMNSHASKLREKHRSRNIKSVMLDDLRPWDSVGLEQQMLA